MGVTDKSNVFLLHYTTYQGNDHQHIIIKDYRLDIRHCAQKPHLHVGPFHNCTRFLKAVNTLHCLI